jgi:CHAT domain-containing protein/tetratricopeptide (TPR) repeat protein
VADRADGPFSRSFPFTAECTSCHGDFPVEVQVIVVADERPDLATLALEAKLLDHGCPRCGAVVRIDAPVLYFDLARSRAVFIPARQTGEDEDQQTVRMLFATAFGGRPPDWARSLWDRLQVRSELEELAGALCQDPQREAERREEEDERLAEVRRSLDALPPAERIVRIIQLVDAGEPYPFVPEDAEEEGFAALAALREGAHRGPPDDHADTIERLYQAFSGVREQATRQLTAAMTQLLNEFVSATSREETRKILDRHPHILSDDAIDFMAGLTEQVASFGDGALATAYRFKAGLLRRCREVGIDLAMQEAAGNWPQRIEDLREESRGTESPSPEALLERLVESFQTGRPVWIGQERVSDRLLELVRGRAVAERRAGHHGLADSLSRADRSLTNQYAREALRSILAAQTVEQYRSVLERFPRLLSDEGGAVLASLVEEGDPQEAVQFLADLQEELRVARTLGAEVAFRRRGVAPGLRLLSSLQDLQSRVQSGDIDLNAAMEAARRLSELDEADQKDLLQVATLAHHNDDEDCGPGPLLLARLADAAAERRGTPESKVHTAHVLGIMLHNRGLYPEALAVFRRALEAARESGDPDLEARISAQVGGTLGFMGHLMESRQLLEKALSIFRERGQSEFVRNTLCNLGNLDIQLGDYDQAIKNLEGAMAHFGESSGSRDAGIVHENLGQAYLRRGDPGQAKTHLLQALASSRSSYNLPGQLILLVYLSQTATLENDIEQAIAYAQQALGLSRRIGSVIGQAAALHLLGESGARRADGQKEEGDGEGALQARLEALECACQSADLFRQVKASASLCVSLFGRGRIEESLQLPDRARASYREAYLLAESQRGGLELVRHKEFFQGKHQDIFNRGLEICLKVAEGGNDGTALVEAFGYAEAAKSRVLLDTIGQYAGELVAADERDQERVRAVVSQLGSATWDVTAGISESIEDRPANAAPVGEDVDQMGDAETRACLSLRPLDLDAARRALPSDTALLEYAWLPEMGCFALFVVMADEGLLGAPIRLPVAQIEMGRRDYYGALIALDQALDPLRQIGQAQGRLGGSGAVHRTDVQAMFWDTVRRYDPDFRQSLETLADSLFPPDLVRQLVARGVSRLIVVPEATLFDVPFAGLRVIMDGRRVSLIGEPGEDIGFELVAAPSLSAFDRCRRKMTQRSGPTRPGDVSGLLLSDPNSNRPRLRLDGVSALVEQLHTELFQSKHTIHLAGEEARKARFKQLGGDAQVILFYGHGDYDFEDALKSALHFYSDGSAEEAETDPLTARELLGWPRENRLDRCSLFAMPACWSLKVDTRAKWGAREIVGFASTLFQRGVASMVGTLWPATVGPAALLFSRFFTEYLGGTPASTALRHAQLELKRQLSDRTESPYLWAPFYLMGDYKAWP